MDFKPGDLIVLKAARLNYEGCEPYFGLILKTFLTGSDVIYIIYWTDTKAKSDMAGNYARRNYELAY